MLIILILFDFVVGRRRWLLWLQHMGLRRRCRHRFGNNPGDSSCFLLNSRIESLKLCLNRKNALTLPVVASPAKAPTTAVPIAKGKPKQPISNVVAAIRPASRPACSHVVAALRAPSIHW